MDEELLEQYEQEPDGALLGEEIEGQALPPQGDEGAQDILDAADVDAPDAEEEAQLLSLREQLQETKRLREEEAARVSRFTQLMAASGYGTEPDEILLNAEAAQLGLAPEQLLARREADDRQRAQLLEELKSRDPEIIALRERAQAAEQEMAQRVFAEDLAAVKRHNAKEQAKSVADLGPLFHTLRAQGMAAVDAYETAMFAKNRTAAPPSSGDIAASGVAQDKTFFSKEEVERMSRAEVSLHYDKIIASQKKW